MGQREIDRRNSAEGQRELWQGGAPRMRGIRQVIGIRQVSNPHRIHRRERRVDDGWQCAKVRGNGADSQ